MAAMTGWDRHGRRVPVSPVAIGHRRGKADKIGVRCRALLQRLGCDAGETLHGMRGGRGVLYRLLDQQEQGTDVIARVGWGSVARPAYYTGIPQIRRTIGGAVGSMSVQRAMEANAAPMMGATGLARPLA